MSHVINSNPDLSQYRINHLELKKNPEIFPNAKSVSKHYSSGLVISLLLIFI